MVSKIRFRMVEIEGREVPDVEVVSNHSWRVVNVDIENKAMEVEILD